MAQNYSEVNVTKPVSCKDCALYEAKMCPNSLAITVNLLPTVDLLVIGNFPMPDDIERGCFMSRGGRLVKSIISRQIFKKYSAKGVHPKVVYTYAAKCCPSEQNYKVAIETINKCFQSQLHQYISLLKPKAILTLGLQAAKSIGLKESIGAIRGKVHDVKIGEEIYNVLPTFHPADIYVNQGKLPIMRGDIHKALYVGLCKDTFKEEYEILTPLTSVEIVKELEAIYSVAETVFKEKGNALIVAIDTETTSLIPWEPTSRMIAISISHKDNYGLAFPWEHRQNPFTEEELLDIRRALNKLISSPNVKLTGHNVKFDQKWLKLKYGLEMPDFFWDSLLAEHLLQEDKKGHYSLKSLVVEYFSEFAAYETELKYLLSTVLKEKQVGQELVFKEKEKEYKEQILNWFLGLELPERSSVVGYLLDKNVIDLSIGTELTTPKYHKRLKKGETELRLVKGYISKVASILNKLDPKYLRSLTLVKPERGGKAKVTFEEIPMDKLLWYAAMDALVSRKLMALQVDNCREDNNVVDAAQLEINERFQTKFKINTKPIMSVLRNITMPASEVLTEMEYNGVCLNRPLIEAYIETLSTKLVDIEKILWETAGYKFNVNSNADLSKILYEELRYPVLFKSDKTGDPSVDANTLLELSRIRQNPFLTSLLAYRKLHKCKNTYLTSWLKRSELDGRIHTSFHLNGTSTGRLSSSEPNIY